MNRNNTVNILTNWHDFRLKIIIEGVLVGIIAGIAVVFYRYLLEKALDFSVSMYQFQLKNPWMIPVWTVCLAAGGWLVGILVKKEPMISGSGIPQVEGVLLRKLKMNWWKVISGKFMGGLLCICAGLSLGREGPSIQIGAAAGQGFSRLFKRIKLEEKFLVTCGASAGLAAAFNAPFAGVIFALEEVHRSFSPVVMTSALAASLTADFISKEFFGMRPVFDFKHINPIPLKDYLFLLVLGAMIGLLGIVFNKAVFLAQDIYAKPKWLPSEFKPVIAFLTAGVVGLTMPAVLGGGNRIVSSLSEVSYPLMALLLLLTVKFLFTMISYGSSAPGGIFMPLLVIGAIIGAAYGNIANHLFGFDLTYLPNLIILAMAGYFAAIVKAPITGCILITEMTGSFSHLLSIGLVCLTAYIVADVLNSKPIYEELLERFLKKGANSFSGKEDTKIIMETAVYMGSLLDGKKMKEVAWPAHCLVVGVKRGCTELIPNGETKLLAGDYLIVLTNENFAPEIRECLSEAGQSIHL